MDWNAFFNSIANWALNTGLKIVIALIALVRR